MMKKGLLDYRIERSVRTGETVFIAGVDEAGRGPLAGPVVAAAVIFPPEMWIYGVDDSKKLSAAKREQLFPLIERSAVSVGIGIVDREVIDEINIFQASMLAMTLAIGKLDPAPHHLFVDGPWSPGKTIPCTPLVGGDGKCFSIAAASIIAKVTRDRLMIEFDQKYPHYGFARHKGYGTREHLDAIRKFGPCAIHRRSFRMPAMEEALRD
jgi:ribonuclease HII